MVEDQQWTKYDYDKEQVIYSAWLNSNNQLRDLFIGDMCW